MLMVASGPKLLNSDGVQARNVGVNAKSGAEESGEGLRGSRANASAGAWASRPE